MELTRRRSLQIGLACLSALSLAGLASAQAEEVGDRYGADGGEIVVVPIREASFALKVPGLVIYNDPAGGRELFEGQPEPGLILICHEHIDHFDLDTLKKVVGADTRLVVNPATMQMLPPDLRSKATALANGETIKVGPVQIEAIPAYHLVPAYTHYHPRGRDNGYLLTVAGRRIYISGDTDATPELRGLKDIDIAFLAISRWTLTPEQGASAVASFGPAFAYPYHYENVQERDAFAARVQAAGGRTKVVVRDWR
ncbi:MBL fold metallo-hydrolase [Ancylobacter sp. A5.8]|uniref:MBL fold metallo-hydrolase n=1 Tax=Ancylobacter gelatini TaxID=2919920 RepID=UPI001F4EF90D|nr:MBL fold metallo-hydrolase [Ancylobacter gelatini]MCJ8141731.1 MBL fold metallo-hydrolase [Ancylobacter gelatini]